MSRVRGIYVKKSSLTKSSASASSKRSVSHHVSVSRAAVFAMLMFFHVVSSIQSDDWALRVYVPYWAIQRWLHQNSITKRAWSLVIGYQASQPVHSRLQGLDHSYLGSHHHSHHIGCTLRFLLQKRNFITASSHSIHLAPKTSDHLFLFSVFSLHLVQAAIGSIDRLLQAQSLVSSTKPGSKEEAKEHHRQNGEKPNSALSMFMVRSCMHCWCRRQPGQRRDDILYHLGILWGCYVGLDRLIGLGMNVVIHRFIGLFIHVFIFHRIELGRVLGDLQLIVSVIHAFMMRLCCR